MKKPYLDCWQRQMIIHNTYLGALLKNNLEIRKLQREILRLCRIEKIVNWLTKKKN